MTFFFCCWAGLGEGRRLRQCKQQRSALCGVLWCATGILAEVTGGKKREASSCCSFACVALLVLLCLLCSFLSWLRVVFFLFSFLFSFRLSMRSSSARAARQIGCKSRWRSKKTWALRRCVSRLFRRTSRPLNRRRNSPTTEDRLSRVRGLHVACTRVF